MSSEKELFWKQNQTSTSSFRIKTLGAIEDGEYFNLEEASVFCVGDSTSRSATSCENPGKKGSHDERTNVGITCLTGGASRIYCGLSDGQVMSFEQNPGNHAKKFKVILKIIENLCECTLYLTMGKPSMSNRKMSQNRFNVWKHPNKKFQTSDILNLSVIKQKPKTNKRVKECEKATIVFLNIESIFECTKCCEQLNIKVMRRLIQKFFWSTVLCNSFAMKTLNWQSPSFCCRMMEVLFLRTSLCNLENQCRYIYV